MSRFMERVFEYEGISDEERTNAENRLKTEREQQVTLEARFLQERQFLEKSGAWLAARLLADALSYRYKNVELLIPKKKVAFRLAICWGSAPGIKEPYDSHYCKAIELIPHSESQQITLRGDRVKVIAQDEWDQVEPSGLTRLQEAVLDTFQHPGIVAKVDLAREYVPA